jgi:hypothetical protein
MTTSWSQHTETDLYRTVAVHEHVVALDVPVDAAAMVQVPESKLKLGKEN